MYINMYIHPCTCMYIFIEVYNIFLLYVYQYIYIYISQCCFVSRYCTTAGVVSGAILEHILPQPMLVQESGESEGSVGSASLPSISRKGEAGGGTQQRGPSLPSTLEEREAVRGEGCCVQ
jgi:hypothetical protein